MVSNSDSDPNSPSPDPDPDPDPKTKSHDSRISFFYPGGLNPKLKAKIFFKANISLGPGTYAKSKWNAGT